MNLAELANETLTQKHRRLMQEKCRHEEVHSSTVRGPGGTFTNKFCLDCGKGWHSSQPPAHRGTAT
jgi:hypothetical protein